MARNQGVTTMAGIADAHGIESYFPVAEVANTGFGSLDIYVLRAQMNRQRHAVCYQVDVTPALNRSMDARIARRDFTGALRLIQQRGTNLRLAGGGDVEGSWRLIPNPALDPWR